MVMQEEHRRLILVQAKDALHLVRGESLVLCCTEVLGYKRDAREGVSPMSQACMQKVCMQALVCLLRAS